MQIFKKYAKLYDSFYSDKDYNSEVDYLEKLFKEFSPHPVKRLLDLGCGTGSHAVILAERGYRVTGIDQSKEMIYHAREKIKTSKASICFEHGDIRNFNINETFDAVISMFAVMSYLKTNDDVLNTLFCVNRHLNPGGLFLYDAWFGPAVLEQRPEVRKKTVLIDGVKTTRHATSELDLMRQIVQVKYRISVDSSYEDIQETHQMRFFFLNELELLAMMSGFSIQKILPFLKLEGLPSSSTWNVTCILKKLNATLN